MIERELAQLFQSLFTEDGLRRFVRFLPDGERLALDLPGRSAPLSHVAAEAALTLQRHGRIDDFLFKSLNAEFPARVHEIGALWEASRRNRSSAAAGPGPRAPGGDNTARKPGGLLADLLSATSKQLIEEGSSELAGGIIRTLKDASAASKAEATKREAFRMMLNRAPEERLLVIVNELDDDRFDTDDLVDLVLRNFSLDSGLLLDALPLSALRSLCKELGLPASGDAATLAGRLVRSTSS